MSPAADVVADVANELETWPGVAVARQTDGSIVISYKHSALGVLYPDRGLAELPLYGAERDELLERGDAEPAEATRDSVGVDHALRGPDDVRAVLELFDRRYRDVRGDDDPYSSTDSAPAS
jgi:hypothetical protein